MPRSGGNRTESIDLTIRADVLIKRTVLKPSAVLGPDGGGRYTCEDTSDKTHVWHLNIHLPMAELAAANSDVEIVLRRIQDRVSDHFRDNGFVEEIIQRTNNLLAQNL